MATEEHTVRQVGIPNNVPVDIGPARLGVLTLTPGPPPRARIAVMPHADPDSGGDFDVALGETFPAGTGLWRFVDVANGEAAGDRWVVVVEEVGEPADLRPFGGLSETEIATLEQSLTNPLPPVYRRWLARTNGLQPGGDHHIPGLLFTLFPERPMLGSHPTYPPYDLLHADRTYRRGWLPTTYLVIAVPDGGLLAVQAVGAGADTVVLLPEAAMTGQLGDAADTAREHHLVPIAPDVNAFVSLLRPMHAT